MKRSLVIALLIVALVFVLAGIGTVLFFTFDRGGRGFVFDQSLVSATAEESKTLNVEGRVTLKVQDDAGNVSIVGGEGETVEVKIVKTSNASHKRVQRKISRTSDIRSSRMAMWLH